ncbi:recombinase family protein [Amycolatopsis pithecellobii]
MDRAAPARGSRRRTGWARRIGYARAFTARQSLGTQLASLARAGVTPVFSEKISTRALRRPELDKAVTLAREMRASGLSVTLVVHEHKRLARGIELATLAEQLRAAGIGLQFLTGELQGSHDPTGIVFTVLAALSGMEREYIRDRTLERHEAARARGKNIGGAAVTDDAMLSHALHLRDQQNLSLRDIAARLVITTGKKKDSTPPRPPSCACCATTTSPSPRRPDHDSGTGPPKLFGGGDMGRHWVRNTWPSSCPVRRVQYRPLGWDRNTPETCRVLG